MVFLRALGSPDPYGRQLDGMGGGISSLSKIVIVSNSDNPQADIDYTFGQVSIDKPIVDYESNCGNLTSAVGPFAIDEGLLRVKNGYTTVRLRNKNTNKIITSRFKVLGGKAVTLGSEKIAGVSGTGSRIDLEFLSPGGAITGSLLPTGRPVTNFKVSGFGSIDVSIVDASTACVFISAKSLNLVGIEKPNEIEANTRLIQMLDQIRKIAISEMGLSKLIQSVPKLAIISEPQDCLINGSTKISKNDIDLTARVISMGKPHKALPLTVGMCLAAAAKTTNTLPNIISRFTHGMNDNIRIGHPAGIFSSQVKQSGQVLESINVVRTQRRLMEGFVLL